MTVENSREADPNVAPDRGRPLWGETRWNGCWSPESGVGIYIHAGRLRKDLDIWWVQIAAYMPDGRLAVDRQWTRNPAGAGLQTESLELAVHEGGWTSTFDGVAQLTDVAELSRGTRGASAPSVRLTWSIEATAASPTWDMYASISDAQDFASDMHRQQGLRVVGDIAVDDTTYPVDGVGFKDHSSGVRNWERWHSHRFMLAVMPDYTLHAVVVNDPQGAPRPPFGALMSDGRHMPVVQFEAPPLEDAAGGPVLQTVTATTPTGPTELSVELVHGLPITITEDNDNLNGIDWELGGDPIVLVEGIARVTEPDGTVGWAFFERSARRSALRRPGP